MHAKQVSGILLQHALIPSVHLEREVSVDFYFPQNINEFPAINLLLINDGQDLLKFHFKTMLEGLYQQNRMEPLLCAGIHCGRDRKMEYGTVAPLDFKGRGARAGHHKRFVFEELIPYIRKNFSPAGFKEKAYAGFSLGGLTAIDVVWNHPDEFTKAGVFSGSLWWRLKDIHDGYEEERDRIMHRQVREGRHIPGLKFYFTTGSLDEKMDRNKNGVIDSIDDTMGLVKELEKKGYKTGKDVVYINYELGRHDVFTWGKAMPDFLEWGWGRKESQ
jgi:enterochelin esterase-like enzyme